LIAVDSSSLIAYLAGASGQDVDLVDRLLADRQACLPPVVLTELLSDPRLPSSVVNLLQQLPVFPVTDGYWQRAGLLRAQILSKSRKAKLADTLIAQSCLDQDIPLVTRDVDFRVFAEASNLRLLP
jgi:predicted nucleic acid-binding protein